MNASEKEIEILREGGKRLSGILAEVKNAVRPGVSTKELDTLAESLIRASGGDPIFKGYKTKLDPRPYPGSLCVSVNDEVVHGIPSKKRILKEGDIVGLDIGMRWPASRIQNFPGRTPTAGQAEFPRPYADGGTGRIQNLNNGLVTDMAVTIGIGNVSSGAEKIMRATRESLENGIAILKPGVRLGDLGHAIQEYLEKNGFGVVRDLAGHGVGLELHEDPFVPNFGKPGIGPKLREGMVIAIEPMATEGDWHLVLSNDGWTFKTSDGRLAAHFEHTVLITKDGAEILTK